MITLGLGFGVVRHGRAGGVAPIAGALSHTLLHIGLTTNGGWLSHTLLHIGLTAR